MSGSFDKHLLTIFAVICVILVAGEVLSSVHISHGYSSEVAETDDGISYRVGGGSSAEYNIVLLENTASVKKVYLYFDAQYGSIYNDMEGYIKHLSNRLSDRGFDQEVIDTAGLKRILSESPLGVGLVIGSGVIPEDVADGTLLKWVKSGGTLYWTFHCIGMFGARSDGTVYQFERSYQSDFLGSECTSLEQVTASNYESGSSYTTALNLTTINLYGGLISSAVVNPHVSIGFTEAGIYGTTLVSCGAGMVVVVSGVHEMYQKTDLVQLICSGLSVDSKLIDCCVVKTNAGNTVSGDIHFTKVPGKQYLVYIYTSGINPAYGKTVWVIP